VGADTVRPRWVRVTIAGLLFAAVALLVAGGPAGFTSAAVPLGADVASTPEPAAGTANDTAVPPAPGDGPQPSGREVPPMAQRIVDTAVWVWILIVVAVATGWVVVQWRRSEDRPDGGGASRKQARN